MVYAPIVRGYLLAAGVYYSIISIAHPFYEVGLERIVLTGLSLVTAALGLGVGWRLGRERPLMIQLEGVVSVMNALVIANVMNYLGIHFEPHKLAHFVIMALAFATTAPSRRVGYGSVLTCMICMWITAGAATPALREQYAFIGLAACFGAIGMSTLMRGAVMREISARLEAQAATRRLEAELTLNEQLRRTAQDLALSEQAANRTKTEFLATITHELRTPLNGVLGMAQVMALDDLNDAQRSRLATIQSSGRALLATINDVLDISKIEAGRLELSPTVFDLGLLADDLQSLYRSLAVDKGLTLTFEVDPAARGWRLGDDVRLRQVMSNLLSNALKFTQEGTISAFVRCEGERVRVSIADTGIGVSPERAPFLFEKFVQADASTTRRFGGSGLGLAISREIVGLMGGDIDFTSAAGEGSCFTFQVPLPRAEAPVAATGPAVIEDADRIRVLAVDDNVINRTVIQTLLGGFGVETQCVDSGEAALAAWSASPFDLILMDIHMPGMDGVAATTEIRRRELMEGRVRTPIVALTASVLSQEINGYLAAGMDGFVAKPIELSRLTAVIQSVLERPDEAGQALAV